MITPAQILEGHEPTEKKIVSLKPLSKPNKSTLTETQLRYCEEIEEKIKTNSQNILVLGGRAGSGKTYTLNTLIQSILWNYRGTNFAIAVTAPTHKALKVLREKCNIYSDNLSFMTLQSLHGLREQKTADGNIIFVPIKGKEKIQDFDMVIVDEGSMVEEILANLTAKEAVERNLHIIYSGDPNQLNPVNEEDSKIFVSGYGEYLLTEIIRQSADNPLMGLINKPINYILKKGEVNGVKGWCTIEKAQLLEYATELFKSEHFTKNSDFVRVLCWTNAAVDFINNYVRKQLFGEGLAKYVVGERLIARDAYVVDDQIVLFNNDEVEVAKVALDTIEIMDESYFIYKLTLKCYDNSNNVKYVKVDALHENSQTQLDSLLQTIDDGAKELPTGDYQKAELWRVYWQIKGLFANLRSLYALTVHNAQGSTFINTFVCMADLNKNRNKKEHKRLLYTGLTRASHLVFCVK